MGKRKKTPRFSEENAAAAEEEDCTEIHDGIEGKPLYEVLLSFDFLW